MNKKELILITGAAGGIGSCISGYMALEYDNLLLLDYDLELMNQLKTELAVKENNCMYELIDITNQQSVLSVIEKYEKEYEISIVLNCAGISVDGTSDADYPAFRKMMDVNFWGCVHVISAVVPYMKKRNKGFIINLVSQSGKRARAKTGAYAATKFALMGYIEGLQKELSTTDIRVSALCPGMVNTRQTDDEPDYDKAQMIQPKELLPALKFLLSVPLNVSVKEVVYECVQQVREA